MRFALLDGLRFVAATAVLLYHFTARRHSGWGVPPTEVFPEASLVTQYGAFGVELFFVISGFVILLTAWGRSRDTYVASRISRLFPAYWTSVLLTGALLLLIWPEGKKIAWSDVLTNFTMVQSAYGVPHVDGVYWTLWAELRFYVIVLVLMTIGLTYRRLLAFAMIWPVAASLASRGDAPWLATALVADQAPYFAAGIGIFLVFKFGHNAATWGVVVLNSLLALHSSSGTLRSIAKYTGHEPSQLVASLIVLASIAAVALVTLTRLRTLRWPWLTALGLLTYPLYLLHEYWGWWVISWARHLADEYVALLIAITVTVLMAWLVVKLVEKPLGPRVRRLVESGLAAADPSPVMRHEGLAGATPSTVAQEGSGTP